MGYLLTTFPVDDEAVFFYLSNGNDHLSYRRLEGPAGNGSVLRSTVGTTGVRDSFLIPAQDKSKYWLIATDLKVNDIEGDFNEATRFGSRKMVIWESENLVDWSEAQLTADIVDSSAGNVWAPEAEWDPLLEAYIVVFSSRFWPEDDPDREGAQPPNKLMYVTTTDFVSFSHADDYYYPGFPVIDATFLHVPEQGANVWYRWIKEEQNVNRIFQQRSESGILGEWTNVGSAPDSERVTFADAYSNQEGPLAFQDNEDDGLWHLWIDNNSEQRYVPGSAQTLDDMQAWTEDDRSGFPQGVKHGSITPLNAEQYNALEERYPS